jgi:1,4-dihydroxy-2-naphthoate octaprenyltransferase
MPPEITEVAGPAPEHFAGDSLPQAAQRLFHATRPKFFPASVLPVVAGSAWGFSVAGQFDILVFALALLATVCVHAGANVLNDVGDDVGGTDKLNEDRIYPYTGGSRFIQNGIMSARGMGQLGISLLALASIAGFSLLLLRGEMILWFGFTGVVLAVMYSLGPLKLASTGFGEIAVGIGLGILPVTGAAWLQSDIINLDAILFALPISAWVTAILLINEVPDIRADAATGKNTLPVRLGLGGTAVVYFCLHLAAAIAVAWMAYRGAMPLITILVPLGLLVLALKAAAGIREGVSNRPRLTAAIESTLGIHTIGSIWLTICALYLVFWGAN